MKGWKIVKLMDVCLKIQDGAHHSPKVSYDQGGEGKFLYITSKNIRNNYLDLTKISYVNSNFHNSIYPRCNPEKGADENKANNMFVEYMLQAFKIELQKKGKGSAQDNINMGTFKNQLFPFPDIKVQVDLVSKLDALSEETQRLENIYKRKIEALQELKQSILQKAFTGELTSKEITLKAS